MEQKQNPRPQNGAQRLERPVARQGAGGPRKNTGAGAPRTHAAGKNGKKGFLAASFERWQKKRAYRRRRIAQLTPRQLAIYKKRRKARIQKNVCRVLLSVLTVIGVLLVALLSAGAVIFRGPSQSFGDVVTVTMLETSALKFVPHIYYSNATVDEIVQRNSIAAPTEDTDVSLITINTGADEAASAEDYQDIEIHEVKGGTYRGYMMIVRDPSRVTVGVCRTNFNKEAGKQLYEIAQDYNAVAAVNGGAFADDGGVGNGGTPKGIVISDSQLLYSRGGGDENVTVGFTQDDVLVVGEFTGEHASQVLNLRDAVTFGPALVINGEACEVSGISSGLNPRTAIGQREDGAVLLLVIDGRQASSLGATHADLMKVMLEYGAVNACNLDGGSSSIMYYQGEYLNNGVAVTGSRKIPTAIIVR